MWQNDVLLSSSSDYVSHKLSVLLNTKSILCTGYISPDQQDFGLWTKQFSSEVVAILMINPVARR